MKKLLLAIGALAAVAAPVAAVVACSTDDTKTSDNEGAKVTPTTNNNNGAAVDKKTAPAVDQTKIGDSTTLESSLTDATILGSLIKDATTISAPQATPTAEFGVPPVAAIAPIPTLVNEVPTVNADKALAARKALVQNIFDESFNGYVENLVGSTPDAFVFEHTSTGDKHLLPSIQDLVNHAEGSVVVKGTETNEELASLISENTASFKLAFDATLQGAKIEFMNALKASEQTPMSTLTDASLTRKALMQNIFDQSFNGFIDNLVGSTPDAFVFEHTSTGDKHLLPSILDLINRAEGSVVVTGTETQAQLATLINKNTADFDYAFKALIKEAKAKLVKALTESSKIDASTLTDATTLAVPTIGATPKTMEVPPVPTIISPKEQVATGFVNYNGPKASQALVGPSILTNQAIPAQPIAISPKEQVATGFVNYNGPEASQALVGPSILTNQEAPAQPIAIGPKEQVATGFVNFEQPVTFVAPAARSSFTGYGVGVDHDQTPGTDMMTSEAASLYATPKLIYTAANPRKVKPAKKVAKIDKRTPKFAFTKSQELFNVKVADELRGDAAIIESDINIFNAELEDAVTADINDALFKYDQKDWSFKNAEGKTVVLHNAKDWKQVLEVKTEGYVLPIAGTKRGFYSETPKAGYVAITNPIITWGSIVNLNGAINSWDLTPEGLDDLFGNVLHGAAALSATDLKDGAEGTGFQVAYQLLKSVAIEK